MGIKQRNATKANHRHQGDIDIPFDLCINFSISNKKPLKAKNLSSNTYYLVYSGKQAVGIKQKIPF
jgi:hypothetical protein